MKALIICRDNIGDTIVATPLIKSISAELNYDVDVLANSYNAAVLEGNSHVNKLYIYQKTHHREKNASVVKIVFRRIALVLALRKNKYDVVFIAKGCWDKRVMRWISLIKPGRVIALGKEKHPLISDLVTPPENCAMSIVTRFHYLMKPFAAHSQPGPLAIAADPYQVSSLRKKHPISDTLPVFGLNISSRKVRQRWSVENFAELAKRLAATLPCQLVLLWSPGAEDNPCHPGDDEKARKMLALCQGLPIIAVPTSELKNMIAATQLCDFVVCSDGGAMHIAAALQKPIVALFGNSDPVCWAPWGVPHEILQTPDENVMSLSVDAVFEKTMHLARAVNLVNSNVA